VVAADLKMRGAASVAWQIADLDDTAQHPALLHHATETLAVWMWRTCAWSAGDQAAAEADFAEAAPILHTNFVSAVSLLTWLANYCVEQHAGVIAAISSVAGERGRRSNYVYGASKAGLSAFLSGLRNRVDRQGVTVLTIKPGPVKTAMTAGMPGSEGLPMQARSRRRL